MVRRKNVAIIPARGGSKRIFKKNIIEFCGKPMLAWTIEAAQKSKLFDRILVSTDDSEIAKVAELCGVQVPFLRKECADDFSTVSEATASTLRQAADILNEEYDIVVQLMPNCPLRNEGHIIAAVDNFVQKNNAFQISCFQFGWMNPWWAVTLNDEMTPKNLFPGAIDKRSQDLPLAYCPTGAIWIAKYKELLEKQSFYAEDHKFFPIEWKAAIDIDDLDDLEMAKVLYYINNRENLGGLYE